MQTILEFNYKKAIQALNLLTRGESGTTSKLRLLKLAYLADRYHLRKYGRPIFNDAYYAMRLGPVASSLKDCIELSAFGMSEEEFRYAQEYISSGLEEHTVTSIKEPDTTVFSETDVEALEWVRENFGNLSTGALVELTHKYPEWKKHENSLKSEQVSREAMNYQDFFENSDMSHDQFELEPETLEASEALFTDNYQLAKFWN